MVYFINALNLQYLYNIVANLVLLESFSKHLKLLEEHDCTIDNQKNSSIMILAWLRSS